MPPRAAPQKAQLVSFFRSVRKDWNIGSGNEVLVIAAHVGTAQRHLGSRNREAADIVVGIATASSDQSASIEQVTKAQAMQVFKTAAS